MLGRSDSVRRLVGFSREEFGEQLTALLLLGCGDAFHVRSRAIVITLDRPVRHRFLKMVADPRPGIPSVLPCGSDPLVLLALLRLLIENAGASSRKVNYTREELLRLLGWNDSDGARETITEAVARYFNTSYQPVETVEELTDSEPAGFIRMERIVTTYGSVEPLECDSPPRGDYNMVGFNEDLVSRSQRRSLFGVDWGKVVGIRSLFSPRA